MRFTKLTRVWSIQFRAFDEMNCSGSGKAIHVSESLTINATDFTTCRFGDDDPNGHRWVKTYEDPFGNYSYSGDEGWPSFMKAIPDIGPEHHPDILPYLSFDVTFEKSANYSLWMEIRGHDGQSNSVHFMIDGTGMTFHAKGMGSQDFGNWKWVNSGNDIPPLDVFLEKGEHEFRVFMREDGVNSHGYLSG